MALQKNSAGFWVNADGLYPVFLFRARKGDDDLYRFQFVTHPTGVPETIESDTQYAYLPAGTFDIFIGKKWGRPLTDAEANKINDSTPIADDMSEEDRKVLAELEAEEKRSQQQPSKGKRA